MPQAKMDSEGAGAGSSRDRAAHLHSPSSRTISVLLEMLWWTEASQDIITGTGLGSFLLCLGRKAEILAPCNPNTGEVTHCGDGVLSTHSTAGILLPFTILIYSLFGS